MKLRYRMKTLFQHVMMALYPKATIVACIVVAVITAAALGVALLNTERGTAVYDFLLAMLTGAIVSLFVAMVVELTGNYRHNRLALHELQDYYMAIVGFTTRRRIYMRGLGAILDDDGVDGGSVDKGDAGENAAGGAGDVESDASEDDAPKDNVQATWELLPDFGPLLSRTLADKKAFLTEREISCLGEIDFNYRMIRSEVEKKLDIRILYNSLNHPDERFLESRYPKNVFDEMPDWARKHIATSESERAAKAIADEIMTDRFLLLYFMRDCEVSERVLADYDFDADHERQEQFIDSKSHPEDPGYWDDDVDEETFRTRCQEMDELFEEADRPFASWLISKCCNDIALCMDELAKEAAKKPYYSLMLERRGG